MATLTSTKIKNTYDAILKATDNDAIGSVAKQITDGLGNGTPLYISTTQIGIGVTPEATYDLHVYSNAKVGGNLTVTGDLTVEGTTTTIDTQTLTVEDPLIEVASNNTSTDAVDIGWYGKYAPSGTTLYAGLFRDTGDSKFKLFRNLQEQPTTTVNTSGTGYTKADLVIGNLEATGADFSGQVSLPDGSVANPALNFTSDADTGISYDLALKLVFAGAEAVKITSANVDIKPNGTSVLRVDTTGVNFFQDAIFGNDIKALFGGSSDLQIYHSATGDSYIYNNTGELKIHNEALADIIFSDSVNDRLLIKSSGAVELNYAGSKKLETTTTGVTVTENLTVNGTSISLSNATNPTITVTDSTNGHYLTMQGLDGASKIDYLSTLIFEYGAGNTEAARLTSSGLTITEELTVSGTGQSSFAGQVTIPATPVANTDAASKGYVDSKFQETDTLAEVLAIGNTTGGTDIAITAGDKITNFTSTGIDDNATSTALTIDSSENSTFAGKILVGTGATASASLNAYTQTVSTNLYSALRIIENSGASSYWDIGATGGGSPDLNFYVNGGTTPKLTIDSSGNATFVGNIDINGNNKHIRWVDTYGNWKIEVGDGANNFKIHSESLGEDYLTIDGSGNVGIGVQPSNADSFVKALQVGNAALTSEDYNLNLMSNAYDTGSGYNRITGGTAGRLHYATDGAIHFYNASNSTAGSSITWDERMRIDSSGNVGIGTTLPNYKLEVAGTIGTEDRLAIQQTQFGYSPSYKVVQFGNAAATSAISLGYNPSGNTSGGFTGDEILIPHNKTILAPNAANNAFYGVLRFDNDKLLIGSSNYAISSNSIMALDPATKRVGIGETNPLGKLHVKATDTASTANSAGNLLVLEDSENGMSILSSTSGAGYILFGDSGDNDIGGILYDHSANAMRFRTNGVWDRMRIDSSGKVLINQTSSATDAKLQVDGDIDMTGSAPTAIRLYDGVTFKGGLGDGQWAFGSTSYANDYALYAQNDLLFHAGTGSSIDMMIDATTHNVGIGETSPDAKLHVHSGTAHGEIRLTTATSSGYDTTMSLIAGQSGGVSILNLGYNGDDDYTRIFRTGSGDLRFDNNNAERMRIIDTGYIKARGRNTTAYEYPTNTFHSLEANESNEPTLVLFNDTTSNAYGLNVINGTDHNNTTSRFFLGQGGSVERIKIFSNGNVANTNNSYTALSDIKLKENITDATPKLNDLMQVKIRNYNLIGEELKQIGVVAQELEEVFPALVYETPDTERQDINKTDEEGNIIYQTEEVLISEAVEGQEAIEWEDKPTIDNTKVEIQTWLDENSIEWQSADTKQELLDRIPEYQQEAIEAQDAVYETRETDIPETVNKEVDLGTTTKAVKYSVFVPMLIKAMQEQQEIINDLKTRIEALEN